MGIVLIGLNHRTAPVDVREKLAFSREGAATALMLFHRQFEDAEAVILSTCNRVELLTSSEDEAVGPEQVISFLARVRGVEAGRFREHLYVHRGAEAVRHVFRVISGLDSMVVGEYQIVNQLKQAYQLAHEQRTAGPVLHRLLHHAFGVSKRARTETAIDGGKTSIPSVAVDAIARAVPDFADRRILMVGAGEMAQLTAEYLRQAEAGRFVVTTRTMQNARALAEVCGGEAAPFSELDAELVKADIVVTATSCPVAVLTEQRVRRAQEKRGGAARPLLLVDLAVPRNVAAEAANVPGVTLIDVDALGRMVEENCRLREAAAAECERIVGEEVSAFGKWLAESKAGPLIEQMVQDVKALAEIELRALLARCPDLSEKQRAAVGQLVDRLVGKLMHPCVLTVRQQAALLTAAAGANCGGTACGAAAKMTPTLADAIRQTRMGFGGRGASGEGGRQASSSASSSVPGRINLCPT